MATLTTRGLCKDYGHGLVVKHVDLDIAESEFAVLVGASGSGKSTILRMIAGLESITKGEIFMDDKLVNRTPPGERDIAMVFQNYALYAHKSVFGNLTYNLRIRKVPMEERKHAAGIVGEMLQIEHLFDRKPRELSGGERQRVALGRAIIRKPRLFLLDEPLSNLDALLRVNTRTEILKLQNDLQITTIYVTHDQVEAMCLADKLVILHDGNVIQVGPPQEIYNRPINRYVASFIGSPMMNFIELGCVVGNRKGGLVFQSSDIEVPLPKFIESQLENNIQENLSSINMVLGIRPEALFIGDPKPGWTSSSSVLATIEVIESLGAESIVHLAAGNHKLKVKTDASISYQMGDSGKVSFDLSRIHLFDADSGSRLASGV